MFDYLFQKIALFVYGEYAKWRKSFNTGLDLAKLLNHATVPLKKSLLRDGSLIFSVHSLFDEVKLCQIYLSQ